MGIVLDRIKAVVVGRVAGVAIAGVASTSHAQLPPELPAMTSSQHAATPSTGTLAVVYNTNNTAATTMVGPLTEFDYTPTSSPAPPSNAVVDTKPKAPVVKKNSRTAREKFPHGGFVAEADVGTFGCTGATCAGANGLDAQPGFRVDGFLGGNVKGFLELGFRGGWGNLRSNVDAGKNALSLYGIDPTKLQELLEASMGYAPGEFDIATYTVQSAKLESAQGGAAVRIHLAPWGRVSAFVGSGVLYNLFRANYQTQTGTLKADMHGLAVPIEAGLGVYVHKNIAFGARFNYMWTHYLIGVFEHPGAEPLAAPISHLEKREELGYPEIQKSLPRFWTLSFGMRARF